MKLWDTSWQTLSYSLCQHKARILSTSRVDSQYAMFCQRFGIGSSTFENICLLSRNRFYSSFFSTDALLSLFFSLFSYFSLSFIFSPSAFIMSVCLCFFDVYVSVLEYIYLPSTQILIQLPILKWQI